MRTRVSGRTATDIPTVIATLLRVRRPAARTTPTVSVTRTLLRPILTPRASTLKERITTDAAIIPSRVRITRSCSSVTIEEDIHRISVVQVNRIILVIIAITTVFNRAEQTS